MRPEQEALRGFNNGGGKMERSREYMGKQDVAELCGVHLQTVNNWVNAGYLTAYKLGGVVRFKRAEVERWIDDQKTGGESDAH